MVMPSTAITRFELGMLFSEFDAAMNRQGFIGTRALRPVPVAVQAANIGKIELEALLRTPDDNVAPGGGYKGDDVEMASFSYATEEHGRRAAISDRLLAIFREIFDAESIHAARLVDIVARNFEIACATLLYDTAVWTGAALTTAWTHEVDDHTNAVPIDGIEAARQKILDGSGLAPNSLICNRKQFWHMCNCAQVVDRLKYSGVDDPKKLNTSTILAELFGLEQVLVAGGLDNSANPGQTAVPGAIWSDEYMMLARCAMTPDPQEPCVARAFCWSEDGPGAPGADEDMAVIVEEYRAENVRGSELRARTDYDTAAMYPQAAHLISNAITI